MMSFLLFALILGQPTVTKDTTVCNIALPPAFEQYKSAVEAKYGKIRCVSGFPKSGANITEQDGPLIFLEPEDLHSKQAVAHELLHLWMATQGWRPGTMSDKGLFKAPPGGPPQEAIDNTAVNLADHLKHRMFQQILNANGLMDDAAALRAVKSWTASYNVNSDYPADVATLYLQVKLEGPPAAEVFAAYLRQRHWNSVFEAESLYEQVIAKNDPRTQEAVDNTVRECLSKVYAPGSKYAQLLPTAPVGPAH